MPNKPSDPGPAAACRSNSLDPPLVLIVAGDPNGLLGLRLDLEHRYRIATATSTPEVLDHLGTRDQHPGPRQPEHPDVVVLDLGGSGAHGVGVLDALQALPADRRPPILVLGGREPDAQGDGDHAGHGSPDTGLEYLARPTEPVLLRARIEALLAARRRPGHRVLVVEDDPDVRDGLAILLQARGYEVLQAADGLGAVVMAAREHPDAMLLDLGLPAGDGSTVLHRLQERADTASIPVIVVSAREPIDHANRVVQEGARMFLHKPVEGDLLVRALETVL